MGNQDSKSAPMPSAATHQLPFDIEPESKCTSGHYLDTGADGDCVDPSTQPHPSDPSTQPHPSDPSTQPHPSDPSTQPHPSDPITHSSQTQDTYLTELTELLDQLHVRATKQTSSEDEQPQQGAESLDELVVMLSKKFAILEEAAREYVRSRQKTVDLLQGLADELCMHHRNAQAAKISGGAAGIVASGLVIGGFIASFFTFGASLALVGVGAGLGVAGGLTAAGGVATELISSKLTGKKAKEILKLDSNACNTLIENLESVNASYKMLAAVRLSTGILGGSQNIVHIVDAIADLSKVSSLTFDVAQGAGQTAFRAASTAGRTAAIAGVVFSVVTIPIDLYTIITSAQYLQNKTVPQVAQDLYAIVKTLHCPTEDEVLLGIFEMKRMHLEVVSNKKSES